MAKLGEMDEMVSILRNAFRSQRLIYKVLEDTDETRKFWFEEYAHDLAFEGLASLGTIKPQSQATVDNIIKYVAKEAILAVVICLPPSDEGGKDAKPTMIGTVHLQKSNTWVRSATLGIRITTPYQNKGYGLEAINWILDWAFRWGGLHRVALSAVSYNDHAIALYRKIGFVDESRLRKVLYRNLQWYDVVKLAMLEDDWKALRGIE